MRYKLKDNLTICQNTYKAAVLNGARILSKEIQYGKFDGLNQAESIETAKAFVKNQIESVMNSVEGDHPDKADILERLEYYMISNMIN